MIEYESVDNYEIIETDKGRMVVNENAGLSFMVPEGWGVEKIDEGEDFQEIRIFSQDKSKKENNFFPDKGCIISVFIKNYKEIFPGEENRSTHVLKQILGEKELASKEVQEVISVDNQPALKTILYRGRGIGELFMVEVPVNQKTLYNFDALTNLEEKERCLQKFNLFLETISIKNKL